MDRSTHFFGIVIVCLNIWLASPDSPLRTMMIPVWFGVMILCMAVSFFRK